MFVLKSYAIRSPLVCAIPRFFINTLLLPKLTSILSSKKFIFSSEISSKLILFSSQMMQMQENP